MGPEVDIPPDTVVVMFWGVRPAQVCPFNCTNATTAVSAEKRNVKILFFMRLSFG
jgi:hypothetical protein